MNASQDSGRIDEQIGIDPGKTDHVVTSGLPTIQPELSHPGKVLRWTIMARTHGVGLRHKTRSV